MDNSILSQPDRTCNTASSPADQPALTEVDEFFALIEAILLSLIARLGPFVVALMPALFTGYSVYEALHQKASAELAFIFALAVAVAIECAGIYLGHNAVRVSGWSWLLAGLYVVGVWGIVGIGHAAFNDLALGIGLFSPVLVLSVYVSHAMFLQKDSKLRQQQAEAEHKRKRQERDEDLKRRIDYQLRLERERARIAHRYGTPSAQKNAQQNAHPNTQNNAQWPYPIDQARAQRIDQMRDSSEQRRAEIVQLLSSGVHKVTRLADYLGVHRNTITSDLKALEEQGIVHKNGRWQICSEPKEQEQ